MSVSGIFQVKQVGFALSSGFECVMESFAVEHVISFVLFGSFVPSNVPTGSVPFPALTCSRMPLNVAPFTHTETKSIKTLFIVYHSACLVQTKCDV